MSIENKVTCGICGKEVFVKAYLHPSELTPIVIITCTSCQKRIKQLEETILSLQQKKEGKHAR